MPFEWHDDDLFPRHFRVGRLVQEFSTKNPILAISNLNTCNFALLTFGLLLHWRPRSFLDAAAKAVPATAGIIQFPLYGGITGSCPAPSPTAVLRARRASRSCCAGYE